VADPAEQMQDRFDFAAKRVYLTRLEMEFDLFHGEHPEVYRKFCSLAFKLLERGHQHYSSDAILHVIRFETDLGWGRDGLKINNNHSPYYARLFAKDHPAHKEFFRFRRAGA